MDVSIFFCKKRNVSLRKDGGLEGLKEDRREGGRRGLNLPWLAATCAAPVPNLGVKRPESFGDDESKNLGGLTPLTYHLSIIGIWR
jgi:hypothetical protein